MTGTAAHDLLRNSAVAPCSVEVQAGTDARGAVLDIAFSVNARTALISRAGRRADSAHPLLRFATRSSEVVEPLAAPAKLGGLAQCGGDMKIIAIIPASEGTDAILDHLGIDTHDNPATGPPADLSAA